MPQQPTEDEAALGEMMWALYRLVYGEFLDLDFDQLCVNNRFDPTRAVVDRRETEAVLCAMGNVAAGLMFRDTKMQMWFAENMGKTCARLVAEAKANEN